MVEGDSITIAADWENGNIPGQYKGVIVSESEVHYGVNTTIILKRDEEVVATYIGTLGEAQYLTFTAGENGARVGFCYWSRWEEYEPIDMGKNMQYSIDDGNTWQNYTIGVGEDNLVAIELNEGETVMFRGNNENLAYYLEDEDNYIYTKCIIKGNASASGDVTSLLNGVGRDVRLSEGCFEYMFFGCTGLTSAPELPSMNLAEKCYAHMFESTALENAPALPATTLKYHCYEGMFEFCTSLTAAPELPATTLAPSCYEDMFSGCTSLTSVPELPATALAISCYQYMFQGCTSLETAPELPATSLASNCYYSMFYRCSGLTSAPELPATTLSDMCYYSMFGDCTSLTSAPSLPATTLASNCYCNMFEGCTGLTFAPDLPATILSDSCYSLMFSGCTSLTSAPDLPATTLASYCYSYMFQMCTNLTAAPELPVMTLAVNCYSGMFYECTSLIAAPVLPATELEYGCYEKMFYGCTSITSHDVATLNESGEVFRNNISCTSLTIHADTPPTIDVFTLLDLFNDCIIYVPEVSVNAYKEANYWSERAAYIQAIE